MVASLLASKPLMAQLVSARPAAVSLTVVVPRREDSNHALVSEGSVALLAATRNAIDFETSVGLADRAATRIEVRLAPSWNADSGRVWIRNHRGQLELLTSDNPAVVLDASSTDIRTASPVRLRVEPNRMLAPSAVTVPLEYRVRVATGDEVSVWTFSSRLRVPTDTTAARRDGGG